MPDRGRIDKRPRDQPKTSGGGLSHSARGFMACVAFVGAQSARSAINNDIPPVDPTFDALGEGDRHLGDRYRDVSREKMSVLPCGFDK